MDVVKFNSFTKSELLISPIELVQRLVSKMDELDKRTTAQSNKVWTRELKGVFRDIAGELSDANKHSEIQPIFTNSTPEEKEFLLDVVWWIRKGGDSGSESMVLGAEIEWASTRHGAKEAEVLETLRTCVGEDFAKLLVVKCPLKVMIFCTDKSPGLQGSHKPMQTIVLDEIDRNLNPYQHHIPGENYIFIDTATVDHRQAWLRAVGEDGKLSPRQSLLRETTH